MIKALAVATLVTAALMMLAVIALHVLWTRRERAEEERERRRDR